MPRSSFSLNLAVGAFVLAIAALAGGFLFLYGDWEGRYLETYQVSVRFRSISSLRAGSPAKLAGQPVGSVDSIYTSGSSTDGRYHVAVVSIADRSEYRESIRSDSRFRIETEGVLGDQHVAISFGTDSAEPLEDGDFVWGEAAADVGTVLADLQKTAASTAAVTEMLREGLAGTGPDSNPLSGFVRDVRSITENLVRITESLEALLGAAPAPGESASIQEILFDLKRTTHDARLIMEELRSSLVAEGEGSPDLRTILANLDRTTANAAQVTEDLKKMLGGEAGEDPVDIHRTLKNAEESAENLREISIEMKEILEGVKKVYPPNWFK